MKRWQKILVICAICLSLALMLGGFVTLAVINYNFDVAGKVEILYDGQNVYAQTESVEGYKGYRFRFSRGTDKFTHDSVSNTLNLAEVDEIELGKTYLVSVCYLGETEGANSRYGQALEWTANAFLARPEIKIEKNVLSWQQVANADYYVVKYGSNTHRTTGTSVSLSKLIGGKYDIAVTACYDFNQHKESAQNAKYKNSTSLTLVGQDIVHEFAAFSKVTLSIEQNKVFLNISGSENISKIDVMIGTQTYQFSVSPSMNFKLDITKIYKDGVEISASPARVDDYNIYSGAATKAEQA